MSPASDDTKSCPPAPPPYAQNSGAVRATVSFLIFGTIGALVGKWISSFNYHDGHRLLKPFGMVVGGLLGGTVAAYSALKVSERGDRDAAEEPVAVPAVAAAPKAQIQADSIARATELVVKNKRAEPERY